MRTSKVVNEKIKSVDEEGKTVVTGKKLKSTTKYYYAGDSLVYQCTTETVNNTTQKTELYFFYDSYGNLTLIKYYKNGNLIDFPVLTNSQGDVVAIYNTSGTKLISYEYDAWGNATISGSAAIGTLNPIRYRGYYYDNDLKLYYLQSRYYDAEIGRFISADSLLDQGDILGNNLFVYCLNNPVNMADPTGHLAFLAVTAAIGAVAGAIAGGIIAASNGGNVLAGIGIGAAVGALAGAGLGAAAGVMLAGSATASMASVAVGAKAAVSLIGSTGGIAATMNMVADNISQAYNNSTQVFWSGGDIVKNAANQFANDIGGKTLGMTRVGTYLENINASSTAWQAASANFANVANNVNTSIYCIQNASHININCIWGTIEYPLIKSSDIIYCIVSQSGTIEIMV